MKCLGIDVGGTFTDFILIDSDSGFVKVEKVSSTPHDQSLGIDTGLSLLGESIKRIDVLVHGTTVATNAILTRSGARTALITTAGFTDVLEIGRQNRTNLYSLYPKRITPLIPREYRYGVKERITSKGEILEGLSVENVAEIIEHLKKNKINSLAISLFFSFFNPSHELIIEDLVRKSIPDISISRSSWVLPVFREYARTSATVLDAFVAPLMRNYFNSLLVKINKRNIKISPLILLSTGGVTQIKNAAEKSVETVLSGLAGGVLGGLYSSNELGIKNALTLDIGGTSTDVASVLEGNIEVTTENTVAGYPLPLPTIAVQTIGAGGGSIARYEHGVFRVGPESAGAEPGPACYNQGGKEPTVTDANLVLGMLNPKFFCGGSVEIFPKLASEVIQSLAEELDFPSIYDCASGIIEIFENNISLALRKVSTERGYDSRNFSLIAFGGAGPLHGCSLADRLSMKHVIIPPYPGVWSAYGLLTADIRHDLTKSILKPMDIITKQELEQEFSELTNMGVNQCMDDGFKEKDVMITRSLDVRLIGQSYELSVPYYGDLKATSHAFDKAHEKAYGYSSPDARREIVNIRVAALVPLPKFHLRSLPSGKKSPPEESHQGRREIFLQGQWCEVEIFLKSMLEGNNIIDGPAIIEQNDSTTLISPHWQGEVILDG
ncbi:hydantoinase/oxoprolinase family protein, partial [Candidatus Hodarchaeum mangrovi]